MADLDQGKLMMLADHEEGTDQDRIDCWKQSKLHWYYKWRMENTKLCWMLRTWAPILLILLVLANLFLVTLTTAAPTQHSTSAPNYEPTTLDLSYATTQAEENEDAFIHEPPSQRFDPTEPRPLPFVKNVNCKLHKADGRTIPRRCGLRELDLPDNKSGVQFWNPQTCRSTHCQCVATKEIRRREKRTIANNKTEIEYRRFRLFECV